MSKLLMGDALECLKELADNSIDSLVTDPPAGIGFMGKEWDKDKGGRDGWIAWLSEIMVEAKRTMKPGGHGLVWALPRTSHWTATALEDAGFEIRDCVYHVFGSGFPKSLNVGKAIDKMQGNEREVVGISDSKGIKPGSNNMVGDDYPLPNYDVTKGTSPWEGWGTALKPAVECWWLIRKPLKESTVAKNVLEYGTGALNIDASRIEHDEPIKVMKAQETGNLVYGQSGRYEETTELKSSGRWPSHLIHDGSDEILEHFPDTGSAKPERQGKRGGKGFGFFDDNKSSSETGTWPADSGGSAARFFKACEPDGPRIMYAAKPSKAERNRGLEGFEEKISGSFDGNVDIDNARKIGASPETPNKTSKNNHPTVKAQSLMKYLIKLITPPEGVVLDPFMGSGSTGVACKCLGYDFVGIELDPEYLEIARARIEHAQKEAVVEQLDLLGEK